MRGVPPTEVPGERRIEPQVLAADVNALHRALGGGSNAVVIGHDWGAIAAARAAAAAPERWRRVVTLAVPPERALAGAWFDASQVRRSAYTLRAQLPGVAERWLADVDNLAALWRAWSPGYEPTEADLGPLRAAVREPAARRAMLASYRGTAVALLRGRALSSRVPLPPQPHLVLHGRDDGCIGVGYAERVTGTLPHPASRVEVVDASGHWLHLEAPDRVGSTIVEFVQR
jgi:pimeloyl-ACP methyl ester carboxylesterase